MNNLIFTHNRESSPQSPPEASVKKNKVDLKKLKDNTCHSLQEVECFLNTIHKFTNYIKLYKILK